jgi:hypothetical protein
MAEAGEDAVERQVRAYNAHDVDEFVACYTEAVVIEDAEGGVLMSGREEVREHYGGIFGLYDLSAEIVSRVRVGAYVVDEERVTGFPGGEVHAVIIYRLDSHGSIDRVRFVR